MKWRVLALGAVLGSFVACAAILGIDDGIPRDGGSDVMMQDALVDAPVDVSPPACSLSAPFNAPVALASLNTPENDMHAHLLPDELTIYFQRSTVDAGFDLFSATRAVTTAAFGAATPIKELDTPANESDMSVSPDGLRTYFASDRAGGLGLYDIWQASRDATAAPFSTVALTPNVSSTQNDFQSYYVPGALYLSSDRGSGGVDIYRAAEQSGGFASPLLIPELESPGYDGFEVVALDELRIYFASNRGDAAAGFKIYTSTRSVTSQPWATPTLVTELATFGPNVITSWISPDGCRLYFSSDKSGNYDLYVASK